MASVLYFNTKHQDLELSKFSCLMSELLNKNPLYFNKSCVQNYCCKISYGSPCTTEVLL